MRNNQVKTTSHRSDAFLKWFSLDLCMRWKKRHLCFLFTVLLAAVCQSLKPPLCVGGKMHRYFSDRDKLAEARLYPF